MVTSLKVHVEEREGDMAEASVSAGGAPLDSSQELMAELGAAPHPMALLSRAWKWLEGRMGVDVLSVATVGPPEPTGYIYTRGPVVSCEQENALWEPLVEAAAAVRPEMGSHPRRRGDRRIWHAGEAPVDIGTPPKLAGPWTVNLGGGPSVVVQFGRCGVGQRPVDAAEEGEVARLLALYLRAVEGLSTQPQMIPGDDLGFEELLEFEVQKSQRTRTAVSLALVEFRANGNKPVEASVSLEVQERVASIVAQTTRGDDRVAAIGNNCLAVIMPKTDARGALVGADRLQRALCERLGVEAPDLSIRIGIGGRDPAETEASELFARASQALAQARSSHGEAAFLYV